MASIPSYINFTYLIALLSLLSLLRKHIQFSKVIFLNISILYKAEREREDKLNNKYHKLPDFSLIIHIYGY